MKGRGGNPYLSSEQTLNDIIEKKLTEKSIWFKHWAIKGSGRKIPHVRKGHKHGDNGDAVRGRGWGNRDGDGIEVEGRESMGIMEQVGALTPIGPETDGDGGGGEIRGMMELVGAQDPGVGDYDINDEGAGTGGNGGIMETSWCPDSRRTRPSP